MDSEHIPCGFTTGLASECNNKKFITLDFLRSLPQEISILPYRFAGSISFSTLFASKSRIYALYETPLFCASIFSFFSTSGSNFNVTGVSFGLLKVSSVSSSSPQYSEIECFPQNFISSSCVLNFGNFFIIYPFSCKVFLFSHPYLLQ